MRLPLSLFVFTLCILQSYAQPAFNCFDINPGNKGSHPVWLVEATTKLYFVTNFNDTSADLMVTDGSVSGTQKIMTVNNVSNTFYTMSASYHDNLIFSFTDKTNSSALWITDGTTAGTQIIKTINPNGVAWASGFVICNDKGYFFTSDGIHGYELWVTDGTTAGTYMVKDIMPGSANGVSDNPMVVMNNRLYFTGYDSVHGYQLWTSDGTAGGTYMLKDMAPGYSSAPYLTKVINNKIYFSASLINLGAELCVTDGTEAGTYMVKDINPFWGGLTGWFGCITEYNGKAYFYGNDGIHGHELWVTDGTDTGTYMLKDIWPGLGSGFGNIPQEMVVYNGRLYFQANDSIHGSELWATDGTAAGTVLVYDSRKGNDDSNPYLFTIYNNRLYYKCITPSGAEQLVRTDGTVAGTQLLYPPHTGLMNWGALKSTFEIAQYNGALYYNANYLTTGDELWKLEDTSTLHIGSNYYTANHFNLYPNPNTGTFTIETNTDFKNGIVSVYDMMGRECYKSQIPNSIFQVTLNQPKGIYIVKLQLDDTVLTKHVVVE